jgi:hypothetical protein
LTGVVTQEKPSLDLAAVEPAAAARLELVLDVMLGASPLL